MGVCTFLFEIGRCSPPQLLNWLVPIRLCYHEAFLEVGFLQGECSCLPTSISFQAWLIQRPMIFLRLTWFFKELWWKLAQGDRYVTPRDPLSDPPLSTRVVHLLVLLLITYSFTQNLSSSNLLPLLVTTPISSLTISCSHSLESLAHSLPSLSPLSKFSPPEIAMFCLYCNTPFLSLHITSHYHSDEESCVISYSVTSLLLLVLCKNTLSPHYKVTDMFYFMFCYNSCTFRCWFCWCKHGYIFIFLLHYFHSYFWNYNHCVNVIHVCGGGDDGDFCSCCFWLYQFIYCSISIISAIWLNT